ncbi:MAG TPA: DUF6065 family protein [Xanthobacteraceae bacterium]|nr:DUF6065 family protein [Xanthobacteraceae bacterium]
MLIRRLWLGLMGGAPAGEGERRDDRVSARGSERPGAAPAPLRGPIELTAYTLGGPIEIRPAPPERDWMDKSDQRYAYRCLPLNIANAYGWEILCPSGFTAIWNGYADLDAIVVAPDPGTTAPAISHFGRGILTFHVPLLFQTGPDVDLVVQGPINRPKDAIAPLTGVVETDWAPYTFTMNWQFTRPQAAIRFEAGEPYCHVFPVRRGELEGITPRLAAIATKPDLKRQYETWMQSRNQFNADLKLAGSDAQAEKWQKRYHRGQLPDGAAAQAPGHRTRVRLKPFEE